MTKLGKYELIEELGRGGYGTVYRAREVVLDVERAVKVLHPALVSDPEFIGRFRQEARIAARLEHPNIVSVYELDEVEGSYFLVMRYLPGGSLKDVLEKEGHLPFERALAITQQVAAALDFAHSRPEQLIHRDVKPGNILFETPDHVRLTDFGFAKALSGASSASLSATGGMIGTPAYMAPEVWRGKGASPATDVYSLACVFAEMLTGQALFQGASPPEIMTKHILDGPELPETWGGDIPAGLSETLRAALARDTAARTITPGAFLLALNGLETAAQERARLETKQLAAQEAVDKVRKETEAAQAARRVAEKINQLQQETRDAIDEQAWGKAAFSIGALASLGEEEGEAVAETLRKELSHAQDNARIPLRSREPHLPVSEQSVEVSPSNFKLNQAIDRTTTHVPVTKNNSWWQKKKIFLVSNTLGWALSWIVAMFLFTRPIFSIGGVIFNGLTAGLMIGGFITSFVLLREKLILGWKSIIQITLGWLIGGILFSNIHIFPWPMIEWGISGVVGIFITTLILWKEKAIINYDSAARIGLIWAACWFLGASLLHWIFESNFSDDIIIISTIIFIGGVVGFVGSYVISRQFKVATE